MVLRSLNICTLTIAKFHDIIYILVILQLLLVFDSRGVHSLLELGTMCVYDHDINTPNIQDPPPLNIDLLTNM